MTTCLPLCYPCYLSRSLRKLLPSRRVFLRESLVTNGFAAIDPSDKNLHELNIEKNEKALRGRLVVCDDVHPIKEAAKSVPKNKVESSNDNGERIEENRKEESNNKRITKPVIHMNVILMNNPCDSTVCKLVNDVLSKKKKPQPLRRSGLATTQYRPPTIRGNTLEFSECLIFVIEQLISI